MAPKTTQKQIDAVAAFVEACSELEQEPFYGKDEPLTFHGTSGGKRTYHLGDRFQFRSALISFRRMWLKTEPCYWRSVVSVLTRPEMPETIKAATMLPTLAVESFENRDDHFLNVKMPASRIVNLWLNTVFAHSGLKGSNKRSEFEEIARTNGIGLFEFSFRNIVRWVGLELIQISERAAKPALALFRNELSLTPSFMIGAPFGTKLKEEAINGDVIIRQGSSKYFSVETIEQRLRRILLRNSFDGLNTILKCWDLPAWSLFKAFLHSDTFEECLDKIGCRLEISPIALAEPTPTNLGPSGFRMSFGLYHRDQPFQSARTVVYDDGRVVTTHQGKEILDRLLREFKKELIED